MNNTKGIKPWYTLWWVWLIVCVSILVLSPYVLMYKRMMFPESAMKDSYRESSNIAIITITNFQTKEEFITARELADARTCWVHNQKNDWDKHAGRRGYTLDLSQPDKIKVIFGYEDDFDFHAFANEIIHVAYLDFVDSNHNQLINSDEILSARCSYHGETQLYGVIIELSQLGMQQYLAAIEAMDDDTNHVQIHFDGAIPSDVFSIEMSENETLTIKGFINSSAAQSLVTLIELREISSDLVVNLKIE